ncbi:MAG TPA: glycoside hydrolase family 2 TIM barrel-domain containing protein [Acidimicrobiales bacterium]|nr:glycoside hydrolase family 2 TIM barrel-domain containing protein [Acidimicrobiales bacterium]
MSRILSLDGEWQLRGCLGQSWRWFTGPDAAWDRPGWSSGRVPGSVLADLARTGQVPGPYFERNSLALEWVPARHWIYRRWLQVTTLGPDELATLCFAGVDYSATVLIDGYELGQHEGCFAPFDIDVTDVLRDGRRHLLSVVVHAAPPSEPQVGDTSAVRVHKSRMGYGWDFCPRMVHQGIWRPVSLHIGAAPFHPHPATSTVPGLDEGRVKVPGAEHLALYDGERLIAEAQADEIGVGHPQLWWPNGQGAPHCYRLRARARGYEAGSLIGFRTFDLVANTGAPAGARPYTAVVNGRPVFLKGWNWVPADALYGAVPPARLAHLLHLAQYSGANCLRVWGGGLLETPEFYEQCDVKGLLVWQEFSMSSSGMGSVPAHDTAFLRLMARDAEAVIVERRHHPSLAIWGGGNELAQHVPGRDDAPLDETTPVLAVLGQAVRELDGGRPFLPTSPTGPHFLNRLDLIRANPEGQHDVHGPWEHQGLVDHNVLYDAGTCLMHSELGVEGMTNRRALEALVEPEHRWPADRSNPVYEHLGAWWDNEPVVQRCFGGRLTNIDLVRRASQHLQYDGLRYAVEARLRGWPRTSGVFPWQLDESYPNAWCTSALDWSGAPKPAYYGVRMAYRPVHVCARFPCWTWEGEPTFIAEVFAWPGPGSVTARVIDLHGSVMAKTSFDVPPAPTPNDDPAHSTRPSAALVVGKISAPLEHARAGSIFVLDLEYSPGASAGRAVMNRYVLSSGPDLSPLLELPPAQVAMSVRDGVVELAHLSGPAAVGITLEDGRPAGGPGWALPADNMVVLLPGESAGVPVEWTSAPRQDRLLRVEAWNVEGQLLHCEDQGT